MAGHPSNFVEMDEHPFPTQASAFQLKSMIRFVGKCYARRRQALSCYRAAVKSRDIDQQRLWASILVSDQDCLIAYTVQANKALPLSARIPLEDCIEVPLWMSVKAPLPETVWAWATPKGNGKYRTMAKFGPRQKAMQLIAKDLVATHFVPRKFQFGHRGVHRAIASFRELTRLAPTHFAHLDIRNFFGSFEREQLKELPVPQGLVDYVVSGRHLNVKVDTRRSHKKDPKVQTPYPNASMIITDARSGIPTGSICSPIVSGWSLSRLRWERDDVALINYADNFLLLAASAQKVEAAAEQFVKAVGNLPGGNFTLALRESGKTGDPFSFLGHQLQIKGGSASIRPTNETIGAFKNKFDELECSLTDLMEVGGKDLEDAKLILLKMRELIHGWAGAFSECDDIELILRESRRALKFWMQAFDLSERALDDFKKHCGSVVHIDFSGLTIFSDHELLELPP
ncbi:hypothetical protein [Hyphomicrobium sp. MC8b]|uniref:hypothetical protein n=1 Tax=Hyphomicrobium sp. MC8b TaxID=300273 RepID=UPI0039199E9F